VSLWPVCYDSLKGWWKLYRNQTHDNYIYFRIITTIFGICITDAWKAYQFHLGNWHHHKQITIDDHDCLNDKFSDVSYEEFMLVIPGMHEVAATQTLETQQSSKNSDKSSRILHCYIHVSDAPTAVSSLSHSRASGLHQSNVHDAIKVQANEKRSIPWSHWHGKPNNCSAKSVEKSAYKCSECVPTLSLCNNGVCLQVQCVVGQNEMMGSHCEQSRPWVNKLDMTRIKSKWQYKQQVCTDEVIQNKIMMKLWWKTRSKRQRL